MRMQCLHPVSGQLPHFPALPPVMVIEDTESNSFWYVQLETAGSWSLELGYSGNYQKGGLYLLADAADEKRRGWHPYAAAGERYTADCAAVGCLQGSWNDVLRELTRYRRTLAPPALALCVQ